MLLLRAGKEGDALAQDLHVYTRTCAQMRVRSRDLTHFTPNSIFLLRFVLIFFCCPSPQGSAELSKKDCPTEKMPNWQCRIEKICFAFSSHGPAHTSSYVKTIQSAHSQSTFILCVILCKAHSFKHIHVVCQKRGLKQPSSFP